MEDNLVGLGARRRLKADSHPAVGLVRALIGTRRNSVGKGEKGFLGTRLLVKTLDQQIVFVIEHFVETLAAHEPGALSVDGIGKGHVVGGDRLGHGSRGPADMEESAGHFLPRPDLGKRAVDRLGHVDLKGLLVCLLVELIDHAPQCWGKSALLA